MPRVSRNVLVIGDSLTYHGPDRPHVLTDERLWPNIMAGALGTDVNVDLVARLGWTARDAWWAVTKDPRVWGEVLPGADALVLAVGGMDHLPAAIPTYLRDGIPYIRPAKARRQVRDLYRRVSPSVIRASRGRLRQLPQQATDHYLARITSVVRHFTADIPVVVQTPPPYRSPAYPSLAHHESAVIAADRWADRNDCQCVTMDDLVLPSLLDGTANPDGIHFSWLTHRLVGAATADALRTAGFGAEEASAAESLALSGD